MSNLSEKTTIPIGWAAAIVMTVVGVVFQGGISYARFSGLQQQFLEMKSQASDADHVARQQELKVQRLDLTLESMKKSLESIDRKLDRIEKR